MNARASTTASLTASPDVIYQVRDASPGDADAIRIVHESGWRAGYAHLYTPEIIERAVAKHCSRWPRLLTSPKFGDTTLLVVEHNREIVGFAHLGPTDNELSSEQRPGLTELYSFYIHPTHWGTPAASCLMERVIETVRRQGVTKLHLTTGVEVRRARRFYEKLGFRETGRTSIYQLLGEVPTPELQYALDLDADA